MRGAIGRPRRRPDSLIADRGYDHDKYRRLPTRYECRADMHNALLALGCCLVCFRRLGSSI